MFVKKKKAMEKKKITNNEVVAMVGALTTIVNQVPNLPFWFVYACNKNFRILEPIYNAWSVTHNKLVESLAKDADGKPYLGSDGKLTVPPGKMDEFSTKNKELQSVENDVKFHLVDYNRCEKEIGRLSGVPGLFTLFEHMVDESK